MKRVLVNLRRGPGDELYEHLKAGIESEGYQVCKTDFEQEETVKLVTAARGCQAVVSGVERWDEAALAAVEGYVRLITRVGSGCDNIDISSATAHGIAVMNTAGSNAAAVAEGTLALMLSLCRGIAQANRQMKEGVWNNARLTTELTGKTVGIVGYGHIGGRLAKLLEPFTQSILICDPYLQQDASNTALPFVSLEELAEKSDIVTVHIPAAKETENMFGEPFFRKMRPTALFLNTSRGALVDEDALVKALEQGWIAGAGLDVFRQEPLARDHPLQKMENVVLTPHMLSATRESAFATMDKTVANIKGFFEQRQGLQILNPNYAHRIIK